MALPTLVLCVLILIANRIALAPETSAPTTRDIVRDQLKKLGAMSRAEKMTGLVIGVSVLAWAFRRAPRLPISMPVGHTGPAAGKLPLALSGSRG